MKTTNATSSTQMPPFVLEWLLKRTLTIETIERFGIYWNGSKIVIPVHDAQGNLLFNKYRRSPTEENVAIPKYQYDSGSSVVLYNERTLVEAKPDEPIFIVEGEFDCLALENIGVRAVSSTGGAGTFKPDWARKFQNLNNITICFDGDEAGMKGAAKVQQLLPQAGIMALPFNKGKDITEFLMGNDKAEFFSLQARKYYIPQELANTTDKKALAEKVKEFKKAAEDMRECERVLIANRGYGPHVSYIRDYCVARYHAYNDLKTRFESRQKFAGKGDNEFKNVPIDSLISFKHGYAPCIWHNEHTASMFYNNFQSKFPNTVKCFGCGAMGDPVDVVMQMHNLDFKGAIAFLKGQ